MFADAYRHIFQGLLLVLLDFRISFFDILPDFLGYILVFRALGTLASQDLCFSKGKPFALALIFMSLTMIIEPPKANLLEFSLAAQQLGWVLLAQGISILELFLLFWIGQGIYKLSNEREIMDLRDKASFRWKFYLTVTSILLVYTPFALNIDPAWNMLMIVFLILQFWAMLLLLGLVRTAQQLLKD